MNEMVRVYYGLGMALAPLEMARLSIGELAGFGMDMLEKYFYMRFPSPNPDLRIGATYYSDLCKLIEEFAEENKHWLHTLTAPKVNFTALQKLQELTPRSLEGLEKSLPDETITEGIPVITHVTKDGHTLLKVVCQPLKGYQIDDSEDPPILKWAYTLEMKRPWGLKLNPYSRTDVFLAMLTRWPEATDFSSEKLPPHLNEVKEMAIGEAVRVCSLMWYDDPEKEAEKIAQGWIPSEAGWNW